MKNFFTIIILALPVIVLFGYLRMEDHIGLAIKSTIESTGKKLTGVPVKVTDVRISIIQQKTVIKGLVVGNPNGSLTPEAFKFGTITVHYNPLAIKSIKAQFQKVLGDNLPIVLGYLKNSSTEVLIKKVHIASLEIVDEYFDYFMRRFGYGSTVCAAPIGGSKELFAIEEIKFMAIERINLHMNRVQKDGHEEELITLSNIYLENVSDFNNMRFGMTFLDGPVWIIRKPLSEIHKSIMKIKFERSLF